MRRVLACCLLPIVLSVVVGPKAPDDLVRGNDPAQFELVGLTPESITIEAGEVRLTGKPLGYFATKLDYQDYTLTFEYRYDRPEGLKSEADFRGNSGVLVHLTRPHKVWPGCVQVQLAQFDPGAIFALGASKVQATSAPIAQKSAVKAVGEWNKVEVTCQKGSITSALNGVEVARAAKVEPSHGAIAWQSEGKPIRFRAIRIKPLP